MKICKVPTLRLKALNKHTHIMYIEMENVIQKNKYVYIDKCSSIIMQKMHNNTHTRTHAHTHTRAHARAHARTVQTDRSEGQCGLTEIFWEEKCLELAFEGRESSLMSLGRLFQMWGPKCEKVRKPWVLCWSVGFWACMCLTKSRESGKDCKGVAAQKDKREWIVGLKI